MAELTLSSTQENGRSTIVAAGEIDLSTCQALEAELSKAIAQDSDQIVVDLREVTFMDSTGLGVLIAAHKKAQANGHAIEVRTGEGEVKRLFDLTGLGEHLGA